MLAGNNSARKISAMPPDTGTNHMAFVSETDTALSPEEIETKAERWPLFRRFIWSGVLIAGTVGVATIIARWVAR